MEIKFDATMSLKEMTERAEREGATELKRILPAQRNLTAVKLGFRSVKECSQLSKKN